MASMSAVGKIGAMLCRVAMPAHATVVGMRRLLSALLRAALIVGALAVRARRPARPGARRALHRDEPIIGSLDTWPAVPRKPQA